MKMKSTATLPALIASILLLAGLPRVLADHADAGVTLWSRTPANNSTIFTRSVSMPGQSMGSLNQTFTLQPGVDYQLQINSRVQTQRYFEGSSGYQVEINFSATFGSAPILSSIQNSLANGVRFVWGQSDQTQFSTNNTLPFSAEFSAAVAGERSRSSADGTYSVHLNGLTLQANGTITADSINSRWDNNAGIGVTSSDIQFRVSEPTSLVMSGALTAAGRGGSQRFPVLPIPLPPQPGVLPGTEGGRFASAPRGQWFDPPLAQGYTFTATGPGLFTRIMAFPAGITATYYVTTEGQTYGPYTPQDSVDLETLRGHGVSSFVVKEIESFVDATSPVAFPIMLYFTEETLDFTMVPIPALDLQSVTLPNGDLQLTFTGVLQSSNDLATWIDVTPVTASPYVIPKSQIGTRRYFRSRNP